ncbi:MAG: hypothetical protein U1F68_03615 [Gammaproteobacteria bacterium]
MRGKRRFWWAIIVLIPILVISYPFVWDFIFSRVFYWKTQLAAGANAIGCGWIRLGNDPTDAISCVMQALERGQAVWAVFDQQGIDSMAALGIVHNAAKETWLLHYDSGCLVACLLPRIRMQRCDKPSISIDRPLPAYSLWYVEARCSEGED